MEEDLGAGYDEDEVPDGFAAKHQARIWAEVLDVLGQDQRPPDLTIETE